MKISFTGDLMALIPENKAAYNGHEYDYRPVFSKISEVLKESDYEIGNLETPLGGEDLRFTDDPTIFNTPTEFALAAKEAGFNFFSLANNHCLDRGIKGLDNTLENLDLIGLEHTGCYASIDSSEDPFIIELGGKRIALLSYTYGTNSEWRNNKLSDEEFYRVDLIREQDDFNNIKVNKKVQAIKQIIKKCLPQKIREIIRPIVFVESVTNETKLNESGIHYHRMSRKIAAAKERSDYVVMLLHSGGQYNNEVGEFTRNACRQIAELGCDLIVVNHPHCVLPFEQVGNALVLYALGNFCFTPNYGYYYKGVLADYSLIFNIYLDDTGNINKKSVIPCKVVKEKNGHSVVYPLIDLINTKKGKTKEHLLQDKELLLRRFFWTNEGIYNQQGREYFF